LQVSNFVSWWMELGVDLPGVVNLLWLDGSPAHNRTVCIRRRKKVLHLSDTS